MLDLQAVRSIADAFEKYPLSTPTNVLSALNLFDSSSTASIISKNLQFTYEIRNAILDFVAEASLLVLLYIIYRKDNEEVTHNDKSRFVSRVAVLLILPIYVCAIKVVVLPYNGIPGFEMFTLNPHTIIPSFDFRSTYREVTRSMNYSEKREVYARTHGFLFFGEKNILDINFDGDYETTPLEKITVEGVEVNIVCQNKAVAYMKDEKPYAILFEKIKKQKYDDFLLETCKQLMSEGRTDCFEYVCPYVLKYDADFAEPYIARYKNADFTADELTQMGDISSEYIAKIAQKLS